MGSGLSVVSYGVMVIAIRDAINVQSYGQSWCKDLHLLGEPLAGRTKKSVGDPLLQVLNLSVAMTDVLVSCNCPVVARGAYILCNL